jgi:hypothetical protein
MEIHFDGKSTDEFFQWMAAKIKDVTLPIVKEAVEETFSDDELLNRKEVSERILNCAVETADKYYLYQPGFPYYERGGDRLYPKKAVEKWIQQNTKYNV